MKITTEEIRHIAALAKIAMTDDEVEEMRTQLSDILEQFEILNQVNTDSVEPTGHTANLVSVMREDEVFSSFDRELLLANTPLRENEFIRVKAVLE